MDATPSIRAVGPREPPIGPDPIDVNNLLVDLALAEYAAVTTDRAGAAAGLAEAQAIVRRHAGIPFHADF